MFTKEFWLAATERAVKTFAQTFGALIVGNAIGIVGFDWIAAANVSGMAAVASVLTSVGSSKVGGPGPSVAGETLAQTATVTVPADGTTRVVEFDGMGAPISNPEK